MYSPQAAPMISQAANSEAFMLESHCCSVYAQDLK